MSRTALIRARITSAYTRAVTSGRDLVRGRFAKPSDVARPELVGVDPDERCVLAPRPWTHRLRVTEDEHGPAEHEGERRDRGERKPPVRLRVDDRVAEKWDRPAVHADLAGEVDRLGIGDGVRVALGGEGRARGVRAVDGDDAVRGHLAVVLEGDDVAPADR